MTESTLARRGNRLIVGFLHSLEIKSCLKKSSQSSGIEFNLSFQTYVNGEDKDDKYWERREKNNMAARRSREVLLNKSHLSHQ